MCERSSKNSVGFVYITFCEWWGIFMCVAWHPSIFLGACIACFLSQITTPLKPVGETTKKNIWEQALALGGRALHLLFWQPGCSLDTEGWLVGWAKNLSSPSSQEINTQELPDHQGISGLCFMQLFQQIQASRGTVDFILLTTTVIVDSCSSHLAKVYVSDCLFFRSVLSQTGS